MPADRRTFVKTLGAATLALGAAPGSGEQPGGGAETGRAGAVRRRHVQPGSAELDAVPAAGFRRQVERQGRALQRNPVSRHARAGQPAQGARPRRRAGPRSRDRHALDLPDLGDVRQGAGHGRGTAGEDGGRREDRPLPHRPRRARQQRGPPGRHREAHRVAGRRAEELALEDHGCRRQGGDREPRRRHAGARAEDARRSRRPGYRRRLHRLGQSRVDD